ncbi:MAG: 50S ribosomal protein L17 [Vicingaceae bacterium]|nr:50S ribosomal protein L17 [Vicingaceae bacterium]
MRHGKKFNHLSRKAPHRKAMLANMACSLIEHKRVSTTVAKGKALQKYIEPLITKSKTDTTHNRRVVFSYLKNKHAVTELFREISTKVADRPGGYTRVLKTGFRIGDNAQMCFIELVDYNENMLKDTKKKSSRKRRGGGAKKTETKTAAPVAEETVEVTEADTKAEVVEEVAEKVEEPKAEEPKAEAKKEEAPEAKTEEKEEKNADDKEDKKEE